MKLFRLLTLLVLVLSISLIFIACNNADKNTEVPSSTPTEAPTQNGTEHTHVFSDATCTAPKTCECGATQGNPKGHSYEDVVTAPTCTEAGHTTHTCACGDTYTDSTVNALGHMYINGTCKTCGTVDPDGVTHTHSYDSVVTAPTCTTAGYTTHTCACGESYTDNAIDALGHDYENGVCGVCGEADPDYIPPHNHEYNSVVTAPTCTEAGYTTYTCGCGETYTDNEVAALGHDYENGVCGMCGEADPDYVPPHNHEYNSVVTSPTCTEAGYTTYTCGCGETYTDNEVAALGHDYENGTCGVCGESDPDYVPPVESTNKADFNTITTKNSSGGDSGYTTSYTTTDGWTTINTAIQAGGSTVMNPQFPVVGPDNTYKAVCLNGKTSAPGKLTSPTLSGGISQFNLSYTKMFTDTNLSVTITITELATGNTYTQTVEKTADKNDKYTVWTYEWVLTTPVVGDFTIEIVNNCPSGTDGNKDRFTILSLEWTSVTGGGDTPACTHTNTTMTTVKATCTVDGSITEACKSCGETINSTVIPAAGHTKANASGKCDKCGETISSGESKIGYVKVTKEEDFTSGTYVIITSTGVGLGEYDNKWVTTATPTVVDGVVTDTVGATWTLTVSGSSVTLKDSNGNFIKPASGNSNGIQTGSYDWAWSMDANGLVTFKGTGSDTTTLASNTGSEGKFRAYKNATVSGDTSGYPSEFVVYKLVG